MDINIYVDSLEFKDKVIKNSNYNSITFLRALKTYISDNKHLVLSELSDKYCISEACLKEKLVYELDEKSKMKFKNDIINWSENRLFFINSTDKPSKIHYLENPTSKYSLFNLTHKYIKEFLEKNFIVPVRYI